MNKGLELVAVFILGATTCASAAATAQRPTNTELLTATVRPEPTVTLPYVPVSWVIELTNTGSRAASIWNEVFLGVVTDSGVAYSYYEGVVSDSRLIQLEPGQSRRFVMSPAIMGTISPFLSLDVLGTPGEHTIRVKFADEYRDKTSIVESHDVTFRVDEATGDDAAVLELVKAAMGPRFEARDWGRLPNEVREKIRTQHPDSIYNQMICCWNSRLTDEIDRVIDLNPETPQAQALKLTKAEMLIDRGTNALHEGRKSEGLADIAQARTLVALVATNASNDELLKASVSRLTQKMVNASPEADRGTEDDVVSEP